MFWTCFVLQDRAVFFEVVRESQSGTLPKRREKEIERIEKEGQQKKCGGQPTMECVVHGETQGRHAGRAWRIRLATRQDTVKAKKGANFDQWLKPRQIALGPLLWEVYCDAYTRFKSSYEAVHNGKPCFSVRRFEFNQDNWGPSRGSTECIFFERQGVVIPFTTYTHTLKHTNHPRCQSRLWMLRKSNTIEARVHSR